MIRYFNNINRLYFPLCLASPVSPYCPVLSGSVQSDHTFNLIISAYNAQLVHSILICASSHLFLVADVLKCFDNHIRSIHSTFSYTPSCCLMSPIRFGSQKAWYRFSCIIFKTLIPYKALQGGKKRKCKQINNE